MTDVVFGSKTRATTRKVETLASPEVRVVLNKEEKRHSLTRNNSTGSRFNAPAGQGQNTMRVSQAGADLDDDDIVNNADRDSGDSGTRDMFGTAMSFLKSGQADDDDDVDEHAVTKAHEKAYS